MLNTIQTQEKQNETYQNQYWLSSGLFLIIIWLDSSSEHVMSSSSTESEYWSVGLPCHDKLVPTSLLGCVWSQFSCVHWEVSQVATASDLSQDPGAHSSVAPSLHSPLGPAHPCLKTSPFPAVQSSCARGVNDSALLVSCTRSSCSCTTDQANWLMAVTVISSKLSAFCLDKDRKQSRRTRRKERTTK